MAYLLSFFNTKSCRPTFWIFYITRYRAILTGKRRNKKWIYITTRLIGGGRRKSQRIQVR